MHPSLQASYDALERRTDSLLSRISALKPAQRAFHPQPGAWSAVQVADHLARTEQTVVQGMKRGVPAHKRQRKLRHVLAYPLVMTAMRVPIRVKAPLPELVPREERPLEAVEADWRAARSSLRQHLEGIGEDDLDEPLILHPVAGPAGPGKLLAFLAAHIRHHEFQVGRLVKHRNFPAA